jgi:hypothetical protein
VIVLPNRCQTMAAVFAFGAAGDDGQGWLVWGLPGSIFVLLFPWND